jgi:hypothetical protein
MPERFIDGSFDLHNSLRIARSMEELLDSPSRLRPVDRQAFTDDLLAGAFVLLNEPRIVPRDQFRPKASIHPRDLLVS